MAVLKDESGGTAAMSCGLNSSACCGQQREQNYKPTDVEQQHRDGIGQPVLLSLFLDAGEAVEAEFNRP